MEGWHKRPLGELLTIQSGFAFSSKLFDPETGVPLIRIRDLNPGTSTETKFTGDFDEKYLVAAGDLLIGMDGEFRCHEWNGPSALLNQRVCRLEEFSESLLPRFLYYGINKYLKEIEDVTGFTTVKHLSAKKVKSIDFPLPPLPEQERIVAILDEASERSKQLEQISTDKLEHLSNLKQSLLHKAFTGELTADKKAADPTLSEAGV